MAALEHTRHSSNGIEHRMFSPSHKRSTFRFRETPPSIRVGTEADTQEKSHDSSQYGPIPIGLDPSLARGASPQPTPFPSKLKTRRAGSGFNLSKTNQLTQHTASTAEPPIPATLGIKTISHASRTMNFQNITPTVDVAGIQAPPTTPTKVSARRSSDALVGVPKVNTKPWPRGKAKNMSMNNRIQQILQEKGIETLKLPRKKPSEDSLGYVSSSSTKSSLQCDKDKQTKTWQDEAEPSIGSFLNVASDYEPTRSQKKWDPGLWIRPRYVSGPIRTEPTFGLYTIPVMTAMDVLCHTGVMVDDQVIDEIVSFFESYGFQPITSDLDKYWTNAADPVCQTSKQNYAQSAPMTSPLGSGKSHLASSSLLEFSKTASQFSDSSSTHSQPLASPALTTSSSLGGGGSRRISAAFSFFRGNSSTVSYRSGEAGIESSSRGSLESTGSSDQRPDIPCKIPPAASYGRLTAQSSSDWPPHASSSRSLFNSLRLPKRSSASTLDQLQQKPQVPTKVQGQQGNKLSFKKILDLGGSSAYDAYDYSQGR